MDIAAIRSLVATDMEAVDRLVHERLTSDVALISELGHYIVHSGGKRLRPVLVLLSARACDYDGHQHIGLAAAVEFIHTATLLHDDVVDHSERRRGHHTANAVWGNAASVLVGDFLYTRAFQMMVASRDMAVMHLMAETTNAIAEGEVMQLINCHNPDTTEHDYLDVIQRKTAKLFEAAACLGGIVGGRPDAECEALAAYGLHLGMAFQLIDDALDYTAAPDTLGKNIGDDLAEGKPTLPLLRALHEGTAEQAAAIRDALKDGGRDRIDQVMGAVESTQAIAYTAEMARQEAEQARSALGALQPSPYRDAMVALADFSVDRAY